MISKTIWFRGTLFSDTPMLRLIQLVSASARRKARDEAAAKEEAAEPDFTGFSK